MWYLVAGLLAAAIVLLLVSMQVPWYTATFDYQGFEARGLFDMDRASFGLEFEGEPFLPDAPEHFDYGDSSPLGRVMERTGFMLGVGLVGALALGGLALLHRTGRYSSPRLIKTAWIVSVGGLVGAIAYFSLNAAAAGAEEIFVRLQALPPQLAGGFATYGAPEPVFWGSQDYAEGTLVSTPGAGWLLAIFGLLNLVLATLLLYRFPAPEPGEDEPATAGFEVAIEETAPPGAHHGPTAAALER